MVKNIYHLVKKEVRTEKLRVSANVKSRQTLLSLFFALTLLLSTLSPVFAEEPVPQPGVQPTPASPVIAEEQPVTPATPGQNQNPMQNPSPEPKQTPAPVPENPANNPDSQENQDPAAPSPNTPAPASPEDQNVAVPPEEGGNTDEDGLEISPELDPGNVRGTDLQEKDITFLNLKNGATKFTVRIAKTFEAEIKVYVNDKEQSQIVKKTTNADRWTVTLPAPLKGGDTVKVVASVAGQNPIVKTVPIKKTKSEDYSALKMPDNLTIEVADPFVLGEQDLLQIQAAIEEANYLQFSDIFTDITSISYSPGKVTVTFRDKSTKEYDAPGIKIQKATLRTEEFSLDPLYPINVTADAIHGQLNSSTKPFILRGVEGQKRKIPTLVGIVIPLSNENEAKFCNAEGCRFNKGNWQKEHIIPLDDNGKFKLEGLNQNSFFKLGTKIGIVVLEPGKLPFCKTIEVLPAKSKTKVRDPRQLTDIEKQEIEKDLRDANTVNGVSKLPNGTGDKNGIPAYIEFNKDGNVSIISPNDVEGSWDNGNFIPEKNSDGSYVPKNNAKIFTIPVEQLVLNLPPNKPSMKKDTNDTIVIAPNEVDTDAQKITITYEDPNGQPKEATATKDQGKWSVTSGDIMVDETTGVVTLQVNKVKAGSTITATVTDAGGFPPDDKKQLTSDEATLTLENTSTPVTVTYDPNGGSGTMADATLDVGSKYTLLANAFTAPKDKTFKTWEVNGEEKAPGTEIIVNEDTEVKAIWKDETPSPSKPDDPDGPANPTTPKPKFPFFKGKTELLRPRASVWPQDPQGKAPQGPMQNPSLQTNVPLQPGPTAHSPMLVPETGESRMPTTYAWILLAVATIFMIGKAQIRKVR